MKKLLPFLAGCLLMTSSFAMPVSSTVPVSLQSVMGEPEPHPNNLYVKLKVNGQTTIVWVLTFPSDTVGDVKSSVSDILGYSIDGLTLHYNGLALDDNFTLSYYGIGANVTLSAY
jgi:hypothetical protein